MSRRGQRPGTKTAAFLELVERRHGPLADEAQKTAATIRMVLSRALGFMTDPALACSVLPVGDGDGVDIEAFLAQAGTLYLIAESEHDDSPVAPLFAAMAGEVHHVAAQAGQASPAGWLDPPRPPRPCCCSSTSPNER